MCKVCSASLIVQELQRGSRRSCATERKVSPTVRRIDAQMDILDVLLDHVHRDPAEFKLHDHQYSVRVGGVRDIVFIS
jgi:hypothetical protein